MENLKASEAQRVIFATVGRLGVETVGLEASLGRVLAEDILANRDLPPFDVSAMDGFALRAADSIGAPVTLAVTEDINAGDLPQRAVNSGQCARIMTGAPMPPGADGVIKVEDTDEPVPGSVELKVAIAVGNFVRPRGESMHLGDRVLDAGTTITPGVVGVLATVKATRFAVYRRPRVAILSTGDELEGLNDPVDPNKIPDSNTYALMAQLQALGIEPVILGIARDDQVELESYLQRGLQFDVLLVSGGSSAGVRDYVRSSIEKLGVDIKFWRVATRPGHPLAFGVTDTTVFFGLPGYPVSSMVCMEQFVIPALRRMMGEQHPYRRTLNARLASAFATNPGRTEFVRVQLTQQNGEFVARPTGSQSSVVLLSMAKADGFMVVPAACPGLAAGDQVTVQLFDSAAWQDHMGFEE
ncbi:MAG: molybdenum cofactor synthesis domain protein [Proteobacteria bacterium]|nr:molybdenum cofactor synthesis domain protein [Pseudomonadota bacterium]MBS1227451.1 molybdenum cofactor synthesis domain protein [Pseudomonadota bacterium]